MDCKASAEVGNVEPLGHICRWKETEEKLAKRGKTCRLPSQNGVDYGGPLGAIKQEEKRFERERPVGWGTRAGSMVWDLKGSQQESDGQQRAT